MSQEMEKHYWTRIEFKKLKKVEEFLNSKGIDNYVSIPTKVNLFKIIKKS